MLFLKVLFFSVFVAFLITFIIYKIWKNIVFFLVKKDRRTYISGDLYAHLFQYGWFHSKCCLYKKGKKVFVSNETGSVDLISNGSKEVYHDFCKRTIEEYKKYSESWGLDE